MFDYYKLINNIPIQPRIIGREHYLHAVVFVPFIKINNEFHFVFQKRAPNIRQGGEISFPGGIVDIHKDKTILDTATRETKEELGISTDKISCDAILGTIVAPMGTLVDTVVGTINTAVTDFQINKHEVSQVFTLPVGFFIRNQPEKYIIQLYMHPNIYNNSKIGNQADFPAATLGLPEKYHKPWGGTKHPVHLFNTDYGPIWGLTAQIILETLSHTT